MKENKLFPPWREREKGRKFVELPRPISMNPDSFSKEYYNLLTLYPSVDFKDSIISLTIVGKYFPMDSSST